MKHTPGPWVRCTNGESGKNLAISGADSPMCLAVVYGMGYPVGKGWHPESEANARLIRAAPEMLEALEEAYQRLLALDAEAELEKLGPDPVCDKIRAIFYKLKEPPK